MREWLKKYGGGWLGIILMDHNVGRLYLCTIIKRAGYSAAADKR